MMENAIHFIHSYIAKKFDDGYFIVLITNYKDSIWHVEYNDGDKEDFDVNELKKGLYLYNSSKKKDICISVYNEVRKDDDICVNTYLSLRGNAMDCIHSYVAKKFDDEFYFDLITNCKDDLWHV